ncbi:MAG: V-type ATP synthase subunit C [bacterium]
MDKGQMIPGAYQDVYLNRKDDLRYGFAVGKIRAMETRLLDTLFFRRLIEAKNHREMAAIFGETSYGAQAESADLESLLIAELQRTYQLIKSIDPDPDSVSNLLALRYDFHNLKVLFKLRQSKDIKETRADSLLTPIGMYGLSALRQMADSGNFSPLPPQVAEGIGSLLAEMESLSSQRIDIALDQAYYGFCLHEAKRRKNKFLTTMLRIQVDFINLRSLLRIRRMEKNQAFLDSVLLEGGEMSKQLLVSLLKEPQERLISSLSSTGYAPLIKEGIERAEEEKSLAHFEKLADNFLIKYTGQAKYITFGVEPLIAFITAKENEVKNLRIIVVGKQNKLSCEIIEERLRDIYG